MADEPKSSKLLYVLQVLLWTGVGGLIGGVAVALINHALTEERELVEARLHAYQTFANGQAKLRRARILLGDENPGEGDTPEADASQAVEEALLIKQKRREGEKLEADANQTIDEAIYHIAYLGSHKTIESLAAFIEAEAETKAVDETEGEAETEAEDQTEAEDEAKGDHKQLPACGRPYLDYLDSYIYFSMRNDLRQASSQPVCPYYAAILLHKCRLPGPFCKSKGEGGDGAVDKECCEACAEIERESGQSHCNQ